MSISCSLLTAAAKVVRDWLAPCRILLAATVAGLAACSTLPTGGEGRVDASTATLPAAIQKFLEEAPAGGSENFSHSPWGAATVQAHAPYYAASGRTCRELEIESYGLRQPGLACRLSSGGWRQVRVLHHTGRPLLTQQPDQIDRQGVQ